MTQLNQVLLQAPFRTGYDRRIRINNGEVIIISQAHVEIGKNYSALFPGDQSSVLIGENSDRLSLSQTATVSILRSSQKSLIYFYNSILSGSNSPSICLFRGQTFVDFPDDLKANTNNSPFILTRKDMRVTFDLKDEPYYQEHHYSLGEQPTAEQIRSGTGLPQGWKSFQNGDRQFATVQLRNEADTQDGLAVFEVIGD